MKVRILSLINVALIPYVWAKFPREARSYTSRCFAALFLGRTDGPTNQKISTG